MAELRGTKAIKKHMRLGWERIVWLHEHQGFPMAQMGRLWVSDTSEINIWKQKRLNRRNE